MARVFIVLSYIFDIACVLLITAFVIDTMFLNNEAGFDSTDILVPFAIISRALTGLYFVYGTQKLYFKTSARKDLLDDEWHQEFPVANNIVAPGIFNIILSVVFIVLFATSLSDYLDGPIEDSFEMLLFIVSAMLFLLVSIIYVIASFIKARQLYLAQKQND